MSFIEHNPAEVFPPYTNYAHAVEVPANGRTLYVSGLNGYERDGTTMPATFEEQAELVWWNLGSVLASADIATPIWSRFVSISLTPLTTLPTWRFSITTSASTRPRAP